MRDLSSGAAGQPSLLSFYLVTLLLLFQQSNGFANAANCGENKALIWQSLIPKIPGLGELNPGISGLEKCPGSRDFGIPGLIP